MMLRSIKLTDSTGIRPHSHTNLTTNSHTLSFARSFSGQAQSSSGKYDSASSLSPAVIHLLASHRIENPSSIKGTGPRGRILKGDVLQFVKGNSKSEPRSEVAAKSEAKVAAVPIKGALFQDISQTEQSRARAHSFYQSKSTIPHLYLAAEVRVDDLVELQRRINEKQPGLQLGTSEFAVRAVALALRDNPEANSFWNRDQAQRGSSANVSVTLSTSNGDITPTIRDADHKGLGTIAEEIKDFVARADGGKLNPEESEGGVFNVSTADVDFLSEVIKPNQAGVVAVGKGRKVVVPDSQGNISVATVAKVTLSCDRRVFDEELAAQFLGSVKKYLSNPHTM